MPSDSSRRSGHRRDAQIRTDSPHIADLEVDAVSHALEPGQAKEATAGVARQMGAEVDHQLVGESDGDDGPGQGGPRLDQP